MTSKEENHNQQYKKNHTIIISAILKLMKQFRVRITCAQIARETGLTRGTIKNHGTDLNRLITEAETALLGRFMYTIGRLSFNKRQLSSARKVNEACFMKLLLFLARRKRIFSLICSDDNNRELLRKMIAVLYEKLIIKWFPENESPPTVDSEPVKMFVAMAVEILTEWGRDTGCKIERSDDCLRRLQVLAERASVYCKQ